MTTSSGPARPTRDDPWWPGALRAAARFAGFLAAAPGTLIDAERRCRRYGRRFDERFLPALAGTDLAAGGGLVRTLRNETRGYAIRVAFFIENFARMAGDAADLDAGLACGAFANLYDGRLDRGDIPADSLPGLIDRLDSGSYLDHPSEPVRAMARAYREVVRRVPPDESAEFYRAFARLHEVQVRSLRQSCAETPVEEIVRLSTRKGAEATLIFCHAARPSLGPDEVDAVETMGAFFQFMDDFEDRRIDRAAGLRTPFTEGAMDARTLRRDLVATCRRVGEVYDARRGPTRAFLRGLQSWYLLALANDLGDRAGLRLDRLSRRVFSEFDNLLPNARRTP